MSITWQIILAVVAGASAGITYYRLGEAYLARRSRATIVLGRKMATQRAQTQPMLPADKELVARFVRELNKGNGKG